MEPPGVPVSGSLERLAGRSGFLGEALAHGSTILYMAATPIFFFQGADRVFDFYDAAAPWLP